jgi:putative transposase
MTEYRCFYIPKAMWFFTVNLAERKNNHLLIDKVDALRNAFRYVNQGIYQSNWGHYEGIEIEGIE